MSALPATIEEKHLSLDEFIREYGETPFEWHNGEKIIMPPQVVMSGRMGFRLARLLADYVDAHMLGEVFSETPFVLLYEKSTWVKGARTPDVMFYSTAKMQIVQQDADWQSKPMIGVPDFAAEIISPADTYQAVSKKRQRYLEDGVALLWLVVPDTKTVTVYTQSTSTTHDKPDDVLNGGDILSGFELPLKKLFA